MMLDLSDLKEIRTYERRFGFDALCGTQLTTDYIVRVYRNSKEFCVHGNGF